MRLPDSVPDFPDCESGENTQLASAKFAVTSMEPGLN